ncbi:hypothetical protein NL676_019202 [Syzygium grande]|nr:hypothetical protein NL676_019202 [Syzygium grande]
MEARAIDHRVEEDEGDDGMNSSTGRKDGRMMNGRSRSDRARGFDKPHDSLRDISHSFLPPFDRHCRHPFLVTCEPSALASRSRSPALPSLDTLLCLPDPAAIRCGIPKGHPTEKAGVCKMKSW